MADGANQVAQFLMIHMEVNARVENVPAAQRDAKITAARRQVCGAIRNVRWRRQHMDDASTVTVFLERILCRNLNERKLSRLLVLGLDANVKDVADVCLVNDYAAAFGMLGIIYIDRSVGDDQIPTRVASIDISRWSEHDLFGAKSSC